MKKESNKNFNFAILLLAFIIVIIAILAGTNIANIRIKEANEIKKIELNQKQEENRQSNLNNCINRAKASRTNLWNANCNDPEGKCTISSQSTVDWIDSRYQQDLENCYQLYGK